MFKSRRWIVWPALGAALVLTGCVTGPNQHLGAVGGAIGGAALGQAIGRNGASTLGGAVVGGLIGSQIGRNADQGYYFPNQPPQVYPNPQGPQSYGPQPYYGPPAGYVQPMYGPSPYGAYAPYSPYGPQY